MTANSSNDQPLPVMPVDALWVSKDGLWIGRRLVCRLGERDELARARCEKALALAFGDRLTTQAYASIRAAQALVQGGDLVAANIRLALAKLERVPLWADFDKRFTAVELSFASDAP